MAVGRLRVEAVDIVRGIAMILMALDHTRDFLGATDISPTDLAKTTVPLFFTRWITHFCAPIFFLLTGTSAYLSRRGRSTGQLSRYLLTRGLWLMFLDVTWFHFSLQFNFEYHVILLNVLWALGWAMVVLAALIHLPLPAIATVGVLLIAGHNLLDPIRAANPLWSILHVQNFILSTPEYAILVAYPLIPWVGVTAAGYSLGVIYDWPTERRRPFLLWSGLLVTGAFVVIRAANVYGDPTPWAPQHTGGFTAVSFLNTTKYPPSLLFLLMTIGPALVLLRLVDGRTAPWLSPVATIGKVPMFYFLLHIPLIHLVAVMVCYALYGNAHWMFETPSIRQYPVAFPPGWGLSLPAVYLFWFCIVLALYPLCRWFAAVKRRSGSPWLSYV